MDKETEAEFKKMNDSMDARFEKMSASFEKTIEDFAVMVANGFKHSDDRFTAIETKIDALENKVNILENKIDVVKETMARREDYFINELGYAKRRIDRVEKKVGLPPVPMMVQEKKATYVTLRASGKKKN